MFLLELWDVRYNAEFYYLLNAWLTVKLLPRYKSKATSFSPSLLRPRYWLLWIALGIWRIVTFMPFPALLIIGSSLGWLLFLLPLRRKMIARRNIEICFPELSKTEQQKLLKDNFINMGIALMEVGMAWWWPKGRLQKLITYDGLENGPSIWRDSQTVCR